MRLNPRSLIGGLLGAGLVAGLAVVTFRTEPVAVDLATVTRGPLQVTVNADGRTRIREVYAVSAPVAGIARRIPVEVGDPVIAGQTVVAVVEPVAPALLDARTRLQAEAAQREAEAAVAVAEAGLRQAEEDLAYTQNQYERTQTLVERGVASVSRLEDAAQALAVHRAALAAARSGLLAAIGARDRAAAALVEPGQNGRPTEECCIPLTAPIDGVVLAVEDASERAVPMGARLVSIGDPGDLEIVADLLSADAVRLAPGAQTSVDRWGGPQPLAARLRTIDPVATTKVSALGIEEQRVDAVFDILSPPEDRPGLGGNFAVFLHIVEWETDSALRLPLSALFRQGEGWAVFTVQDGIATRSPVAIGRRNATEAEVLSGLAEGARVITHPGESVTEGARVVDRAAL